MNNTNHMQIFLDYLRDVYGRCNDHLLEQGKKRDQFVTFYIVFLAFILTNTTNINRQFSLNNDLIQIVVYLISFVVGVIVVLNLADLRGWHQQYIDCIYVLNWTFAHADQYEYVNDLKAEIERRIKKTDEHVQSHAHPITRIGELVKFFLNKFWKSTDNVALF